MPDLSTHRFFRIDPAVYTSLTDYVDTSRGYPNERTTRGLPLFEWLLHDEDGWGLLAIDKWRFVSSDEAVVTGAIDDGTVEEITTADYLVKRAAIFATPVPVPPDDRPVPPEAILVPPEAIPVPPPPQ